VARSAAEQTPERSFCAPDATLVVDRIVADGPLPVFSRALFAMTIVAGRDGIAASLDGRTSYLTADDLLVRRASREGFRAGRFNPRLGLDDPDPILDELASSLGTDRAGLEQRGQLRRILTRREGGGPEWPADRELDRASLRDGLLRATAYLVRHQFPDGRF